MAIIGLSRLSKKLKQLPDAADQALRPVMEGIAAEVVALAQALAPVDDGELRDSIGWTWGDAPPGSLKLGQVQRGGRRNIAITIYAGNDIAFYARWVEFGTSSHNLGKGGSGGKEHPGSTAQPFFYPAWRARRKSAKSKLSRAINRSAKRVAAGG